MPNKTVFYMPIKTVFYNIKILYSADWDDLCLFSLGVGTDGWSKGPSQCAEVPSCDDQVHTKPSSCLQLWVRPDSLAARQKAFYDEHLGPFYRIEQVSTQ